MHCLPLTHIMPNATIFLLPILHTVVPQINRKLLHIKRKYQPTNATSYWMAFDYILFVAFSLSLSLARVRFFAHPNVGFSFISFVCACVCVCTRVCVFYNFGFPLCRYWNMSFAVKFGSVYVLFVSISIVIIVRLDFGETKLVNRMRPYE